MTFVKEQRVLVRARVAADPGSDKIRVSFRKSNVYNDDGEEVQLVVDAGDVQKASPRFRAGQVYEYPGTGMRYFITDAEGGYTDSDGMMGDLLSDENLELILDVEES